MLTFWCLPVLGEAEVNDVEVVLGVLLPSDQKVIWLDVTVDDALLVALLYPLHHLQADHATRLEVELVAARLEQVFQALAQHVHDHHVELVVRYGLVGADVVQLWYVSYR